MYILSRCTKVLHAKMNARNDIYDYITSPNFAWTVPFSVLTLNRVTCWGMLDWLAHATSAWTTALILLSVHSPWMMVYGWKKMRKITLLGIDLKHIIIQNWVSKPFKLYQNTSLLFLKKMEAKYYLKHIHHN